MDSPSSSSSIAPTSMATYYLPSHRLRRTLRDGSKTPIALVACGSFSPVTYLHLRMFEMARDYIRTQTNFEVVAGYMSPVNDDYKKPGLLSAYHRVNMCTLATEQTSDWLMCDAWEGLQPKYQPTAIVLDHFDNEINRVIGGVTTPDGEYKRVRVILLAGADLIHTMSEPGVWSTNDLEHILGRYGAVIVERTGTDTEQALANLVPWRDNIFLVPQTITNDVSSTKVRLFLKRGMSVRYLLPAPVVEYIESHHLYADDTGVYAQTPETDVAKEKARPLEVPGQPSPTPSHAVASGSGPQQQS